MPMDSGQTLKPAIEGAFTLLIPTNFFRPDARDDEALLERAGVEGPVAAIWHTERSLVVPRSYRRYDGFEAACQRFAQEGWPVTVRQTGGGIVPQGPGIVNLSLAYSVDGPPMQHSEAGYLLICQLLAEALNAVGIEAFPAAVDGSFCDGRYNLAVQRAGAAVKIAGTAQSWRRKPGSKNAHLGLVHALVLIDTDTAAATHIANAFEAAIGSSQRYQAEKVVSAAELLGRRRALPSYFEQALVSAVSRARPPCPTITDPGRPFPATKRRSGAHHLA